MLAAVWNVDISLFRVVFGTLYPAYSSYKAVKSKDVKEYVSTLFLLFIENNLKWHHTDY